MHRCLRSRCEPCAKGRTAIAAACLGLLVNLAFTLPAWSMDTLAPVQVEGLPAARLGDLHIGSRSLIDREDIERSGARNVVEVLAREAGVNLSSFFSNAKFSGVDLRGQGETSTANVLILVDGVRLNVDQAGPDLSTLALGDIETIEVRRGAQSVTHGDGAVGGVIEIRTRRSFRTHAETTLRVASFDQQRVSLEGGTATRSADLRIGASRTLDGGFRANSAFEATNLSARAGWRALETLEFAAGVQRHQDHYGLPGFVTREQFAAPDGRRAASDPFGGGRTEELRFDAGLAWQPHTWLRLETRYAERRRTNPFSIAPAGPVPTEAERNHIGLDARQGDLRLSLNPRAGLFSPHLDLGGEWREAAVDSRRNGESVPAQSTRREVAQQTFAAFAHLRLGLGAHWLLDLGARQERTDVSDRLARFDRECTTVLVALPPLLLPLPGFPGVFVPVPVPPVPTLTGCTPFAFQPETARDAVWDNAAWQAGIAWSPQTWFAMHGRVATSFRSPNPDDLALGALDLRPQRGEEVEGGLRLGLGQRGSLELAAFASQSHDEIRFERGINRNLPGSIERRGLELSLTLTPVAGIDARLNLTQVDARFREDDTPVPLVPELAGSAAIGWELPAGQRLDFSSLFAGSRPDGAALGAARFPRVPGWHVESLAWSWRSRRLDVQAGVNNLLDATWATTAFGATYYPLMGREVYARIALALP
ncbi:MAG TPA: hypothetical protein DCY89_06990 [Gammaproteobacteria bacterium]|nr:hypothetical protein [Gammaproteobacteria bacterium]